MEAVYEASAAVMGSLRASMCRKGGSKGSMSSIWRVPSGARWRRESAVEIDVEISADGFELLLGRLGSRPRGCESGEVSFRLELTLVKTYRNHLVM